MRTLIFICALCANYSAQAGTLDKAIARSAARHGVSPTHLRLLAAVESSSGRNVRDRYNKNGTIDRGIMQINSVHWQKCGGGTRLHTAEGSIDCAARLVAAIRPRNLYDLAKYHSKTPSKRLAYYRKLQEATKWN